MENCLGINLSLKTKAKHATREDYERDQKRTKERELEMGKRETHASSWEVPDSAPELSPNIS